MSFGQWNCMQILKRLLPLGLALSASIALADRPTVQAEKRKNLLIFATDQADRGLVLFPGVSVPPERYSGLAQALLDASDGRLAVMIPAFFGNFPNPLEANARVDEALAVMTSLGIKEPASRLFAGGHSEGGIRVHSAVKSRKLAGLVLLASFINRTPLVGDNISSYPAPVLTLGAELDGLTGINYIAREAKDALMGKAPSERLRLPVIILRGQNHMQFADGAPLDGDLASEISLPSAHLQSAHAIEQFIRVQLADGENPAVDKAAQIELLRMVNESLELLKPLTDAFDGQADVCTNMQKDTAPLADNGWQYGKVISRYYDRKEQIFEFIWDKSRVTSASGVAQAAAFTVEVPVFAEFVPNPIDYAKDQSVAPAVIACKLRSQAAISLATGIKPASSIVGKDCATMNADIILSSLSKLSDPASKARFNARYGDPESWTLSSSAQNQLQLGPISIQVRQVSSGQSWVAGAFRWSKNQDDTADAQWQLNTVELITPPDFPITAFAGAHYCKVIAPLKVLEWATLFGLDR